MHGGAVSDDLRPKSHGHTVIMTAIAVAGAVWGATTWLGNRADKDDVKALSNNSFQQRLDMETVKGDVKALYIQVSEFRSEMKSISKKLDDDHARRR